jgi:hypothetical protein
MPDYLLFLGNKGIKELVFSIYSLYCDLVTDKLFSKRAAPDTRRRKKDMIIGLKMVPQPAHATANK